MKIKALQCYGYNIYAEKCDNCGEQSRAHSEDIKELNRLNRLAGWSIEYINGKTKAKCPKCKESDNGI